MLNNVKPEYALAEMFLRRETWLRLGEQLHPGEYASRYSRIAGLFKALRDKAYPKSWAGQVEKLLSKGRIAPMVEQLRERPGVFARKLAVNKAAKAAAAGHGRPVEGNTTL